MVEIKEVITRKDRRRFFGFPNRLYKDCRYYVPLLTADEQTTFNPKVNGAFQYASAKLWLAYKDGKVVGRIGGILNNAANSKENTRMVRFTRFDFIDDYEVSEALLKQVTEWARSLGMNQLTGPLGFSNLDKQGMLTEGFEEMDMYITLYNYPYYVKHMEHLGLRKRWDWVEMMLTVPDEMPERVERGANLAIERYGYQIKHFTSMKQVKPYMHEALEIINEAFAKLHGVVPLSKKQMDGLAHLINLVGIPEYTLMVTDAEDKMVGFGFMAPSISRGIKSGGGKLGPLTIFKVFKDLRDHSMIDFYLIGVRPEHQNHGVEAIILRDGIRNIKAHGAVHTQTGPMLEDNNVIQNGWKKFDYRYHRHRRCWIYDIPGTDAEGLSKDDTMPDTASAGSSEKTDGKF